MTKHIPNKRFEKGVVKQILIRSPYPYRPFEEEATFSRFFSLLKVSITSGCVCWVRLVMNGQTGTFVQQRNFSEVRLIVSREFLFEYNW